MSEDYEKDDRIQPFIVNKDPSILLNDEDTPWLRQYHNEGHTSRESSLLCPLNISWCSIVCNRYYCAITVMVALYLVFLLFDGGIISRILMSSSTLVFKSVSFEII